MKIQYFENGRWIDQQVGIKFLYHARRKLYDVFDSLWDDDRLQYLANSACESALGAEVGEIIVGATGTKWRISY